MSIKNIKKISNGVKIAVITDTFYTINGVSRTYQQLVKYCQEKKIALDVFTIGKSYKKTKKGSVNIYQFAAHWPVYYYYDLPPFDARIISPGLKEKFNNSKYDLIHLATPGSLGIAARLILANDPTPKVGVFHTLLDEYAGGWTEKSLEKLPEGIKKSMTGISQSAVWNLLRWFYAKTDLVLAPSKVIQSRLGGFGKPIEIFPRGVDTKVFNPKNRDEKLTEKTPTALYVGRLSIEKNLDLLVKVWQNRPDVKLWLVGDGPYKNGLKAQLPQAKFFGYLTGKKLSQVYASADFFIFPSTTDTFGNVILEAQASGLPTIITNIGGPQELVRHKVDGLIVNPSAKDFNQAIDYLLKDKVRLKNMGQKSLEIATERSWPKAFEKLFKIYEKLM